MIIPVIVQRAGEGAVNSMSAAASPPPGSREASLLQHQEGAISWQQVHIAIVALGERASSEQLQGLRSLLERFVAENERPATSPNLRATAPDRLDTVAALLERQDVSKASPATCLLALKALKILARRQDVRQHCTQHVINVVTLLLDAAGSAGAPGHHDMATEAANALSNLCYEPGNCTAVVKAGAVPRLLKLLMAEGSTSEARANAAGALQTLSFQPDARAAVIKAGGPTKLLRVLNSIAPSSSNSSSDKSGEGVDVKLLQRLAGALHNVSSSAEGIAMIRHQGGVASMVSQLTSTHPGVPAAAAGTLQNMSRDAEACADIRAHPDSLPGLVALLTGADIQAAVCAAGTLTNLAHGSSSQDALMQALASALAGSAVCHSLQTAGSS